MKADGVFIFAGMKPNTSLFEGKLKTDELGYIITDQHMRTSISGIFAAGDIINKPYRQITTSVSDGTIAAITAEREINSI
jgi:thioredoxin reductase (NADPH)